VSEIVLTVAIKAGDEAEVVTVTDEKHSATDIEIL
jgi:hypothetical protein